MYTLTYDGQLVELYETHMCLMIFLKKAHMEFYTNTTGDLILMSRHRQPDAVSIKELLLLCESHRKIMESSGKPLSLPTVEGRSYPCSVGLSGAFVKLLKANISFIMSVCPFVRPSTWNNSTPNGRIFKKKNCHLNIFWKSVEISQVLLKIYKNNGYFTWRPMHSLLPHLSQFFLELEIFQIKAVE